MIAGELAVETEVFSHKFAIIHMRNSITAFLILAMIVTMGHGLFGADLTEHQKNRPKQYTCKTSTSVGGVVISGRMYQDGAKHRVEQTSDQNLEVRIIRTDLDKFYLLLIEDEAKIAMETKCPPAQSQGYFSDFSKAPADKKKSLGVERVNGVSCDKFSITLEYDEMVTVWISQQHHTVQRFRRENKESTMVIDFSEYDLKPQAAALFEVPAEYERRVLKEATP